MLHEGYRNMPFSKLLTVAVLLAPTVASAHLRITSPTPRFSDDRLKDRHCGAPNSTRVQANVQTRRPGSMMKLVWDRYVPHPGWIRVSFQQNGDVFRIPPVNANAANGYPEEDLTGQMDPDGSGSLIIKDRIPELANDFTFQLPDVECDNCTVQVIQMMTDKPPYTIDLNSNDIYFACVDLVLSRTAAETPDPAPTDPTPNPNNGDPADDPDTGNVSGGCSTTASTSALMVLALAGLRRRRRASNSP